MSELKYGPQTYQVEKLLLKIESLAQDQIKELYTARDKAWYAAPHTVRDAAWNSIRYAVRGVVRYAAQNAARDAVKGAAQGAAQYVAWGATLALLARDLIGEKFTQEHYDLLTKPWRSVMGEFEEPEADK